MCFDKEQGIYGIRDGTTYTLARKYPFASSDSDLSKIVYLQREHKSCYVGTSTSVADIDNMTVKDLKRMVSSKARACIHLLNRSSESEAGQ